MYLILAPFFLCLLIYIAFILRNAWHFSRHPNCKSASPSEFPYVSVIVPARNEEKNIEACLKAILAQQYPDHLWEVILVNDHSTDQTLDTAHRIAASHSKSKLKVFELEEGKLGKKSALSLAIEKACGEVIVQTDADCVMGKYWLAAMMSYWDEDVGLISGPVRLTYGTNLLEKFQALESMGLVAIGAGSLIAGQPNMCNGANLSYSKAVFESINGFRGIDEVASGDDELLMQKINLLGKYRLVFAKCRTAIVSTSACNNWQDLKAQRLRWVSKARNYLDKSVNLIQAISWLGFCIFPILLVASFWNPELWWLLLLAFVLKLVADIFLLYQSAKFFHNLRLISWIFPLQIVYILYVLWIGIAGNLVKNYNWKSRKVR